MMRGWRRQAVYLRRTTCRCQKMFNPILILQEEGWQCLTSEKVDRVSASFLTSWQSQASWNYAFPHPKGPSDKIR